MYTIKRGEEMDIAQLSTAKDRQDLGTAVSMAVMKLGKDVIEQNGSQLVASMKDMERSINPHIGNNIDTTI